MVRVIRVAEASMSEPTPPRPGSRPASRRPSPCSAGDSSHRRARLSEECWPKINALILLQSGNPHVIVQRVIGRMHPLRENDKVRVVQSHRAIRIHGSHRSNRLRNHNVEGKLMGHRIGSHRNGYRLFSGRRGRDTAHTQVTLNVLRVGYE
eukprot:5262619-Pleurochrysis_carterae.AAC.2